MNFIQLSYQLSFLHEKFKKNMELEAELSPFISVQSFYNDILLSETSTNNAMFFSNYYKKHWSELKINYNLFWNNKLRLLKPKIKNELPKYPHIGVTEVHNMQEPFTVKLILKN